ncbi:MAG: putative ABC transporter permease [Coriobacteriales bacterium]|jgi:uncharacterized membrane protein|nr:putative ABC transporter permease [Coriobacteriales bacterium]
MADNSKKISKLKKAPQGYIPLKYYNLFWIFILCSVIGLLIETLYQYFVFGDLESRASLVFGPFSTIYGVGGVLLTVFLNRIWDKNIFVIFIVSMVVGMALEFFTSWAMEALFGITAWYYGGMWGNIGGRTSIGFGIMWGMLGVLWIRFLLPWVLRIINLIPFRWHIVFTVAMSIFMALDIAVTLVATNRWYERERGIPATNVIQQQCDRMFPDTFMEDRFQNATMYPSSAAR